MADNQILIELLARADFQQAIAQFNTMKLKLNELQFAASKLATIKTPLIFSSRGLEDSARGVRRLRGEVAALIPLLTTVYAKSATGFQMNPLLSAASSPITAARLLGSPYTSGASSYTNFRSNRVPGVYDLVPLGNRSFGAPNQGGGGIPPAILQGIGGGGSGAGGAGSAGANNRFNFGQIFTGFLALGAARQINSFIGDSVNKFAELEFTLKRVQIVMKPTSASMTELKDTILGLSKALPVSIKDLSEASITIAQAGVKNLDELKSTLLTASITALRFGDNLQNTVLNLITTANEFGISISELSRVSSVLSIVSGDTVANIKDIGSALGQVGPGAKALGVSLEEVAVSIGIAKDVGIQASRAGTNLRNLFTQFEKVSEGFGTGRQKQVLDKFGISLDDINIKTKGYTTVLQNLSKVNLSLADAQELVQQRNGVLLLALLDSARGADFASTKFGQLLQRAREGTDLFKDLQEQLGTVKANQILLGNAVDRFKINLGETFGIFLNVVRPSLVAFLNILSLIPPPIVAINLVLASLLLTLTGVGLLLPVVVGSLGGLFVSLKTVSVGFFSLILGLVEAIAFAGPFILAFSIAAVAVDSFTASLRSGNNPIQAFNNALIDTIYWMLRMGIEAQKLATFGVFNKFFDEGIKKLDAFRDASKKALGIEPTKTTGVVTDLNNKFKELIATITDSDVAKKLEEWWKQISKFRSEVQKTAEETDKFTYRVKNLAIQSQQDFQNLIDGMIPTWSNAIFELVKGTKTFGDVWQDVLDYSLKSFIEGFLQGMFGAFNQNLGAMFANYLLFAQATGQGAGGAVGGGGFGGILGGLGKVFGIAGGAGGGGYASSGGAFSSVSSLSSANIPSLGFAEGGIATKPTFGVFGEAGPEALIPLDRWSGMNSKNQNITVVNIVDQNFVHQALVNNPDVIVNTINADLIRNGTTRKTIKRYTQ